MRVVRLDAGRVGWLTPRDTADMWRLALGEGGYLVRRGEDPAFLALERVEHTLEQLERAEADLSEHMRRDPAVTYPIPLAVYPMMGFGLLALWSMSMAFAGPSGVLQALLVMSLGAGVVAWLGVGWHVGLRRAWALKDRALTEVRDGLRITLREVVAEANARAWIGDSDGVRVVSAPDIDWLRSCRRKLLEYRPKAPADATLKAEVERIEDAVATALDPAVLETDRAFWVAALLDEGVAAP